MKRLNINNPVKVIDDAEEVILLHELRLLQAQLSKLREENELGIRTENAPAQKTRVIVASYDLPVSAPVPPQNDTGKFKASDRPLLSPLNIGNSQFSFNPNVSREESYSLGNFLETSDEFDYVWVGGLDVHPFELSELQAVQHELMQNHKCVPVFAYGETFDLHYNGFCKDVLWPLLHGIPPTRLYTKSLEDSVDIAWKAYLEVNEAFAQQILQIYNPETDIIWIHDYHLFLVPFILRQQIPDCTVGFFLHTPFSSSEIFRILPYRKQVLQGMLAADLIGMQTYTYARQFLGSCSGILGLEATPNGIETADGHYTHLRICPVGIDEKHLSFKLKEPGMLDLIHELREKYGERKIIVGIDEMDYIKGIIHKLSAFESFLRLYPKEAAETVLIQVVLPVRSESADYVSLKSQVNEQIGRINSTFGKVDYLPIHYIHRSLAQYELDALLSIADVGLITPLKDGMNLIPFHFIASQRQNHGVLILSEFAGSSFALKGSLIVNPWATDELAAAIHAAVVMPDEDRAMNHEHAYAYVRTHDSSKWAKGFLGYLRAIGQERRSESGNHVSSLDMLSLRSSFLQSRKRLFVFDYDGTLVSLQSRPHLASLSEEKARYIQSIASDPANTVLVISGRTRENMEDWLGKANCSIAAEHGCFLKKAGDTEWISLAPSINFDWWDGVRKIMEHYTERTPGSFLEPKETALTWHFYDADPEFGAWQARELQNHLASVMTTPQTVLVNMSKTVEVRPEVANKFSLIRKFCKDEVSRTPIKTDNKSKHFDFIMCVGDDRSDEEMFRFFKHVSSAMYKFTCVIQERQNTAASYFLRSPDHLRDVLELLSTLSRTENEVGE